MEELNNEDFLEMIDLNKVDFGELPEDFKAIAECLEELFHIEKE